MAEETQSKFRVARKELVSPRVVDAGIDLYWLPLGAGGRFVRFNGRVYEERQELHEIRRAPQHLAAGTS